MIKLLPINLMLTLCFALPWGLQAEDAFDGGVISLMDGSDATEICVGDGIPDPIMVMLMDAEGDFMTWVVTDTDGKILAIQEGNTFDFEGAGAGTCVIWHMAYKDIVGPFEVGMNKDNVQGWLDYSNPVTVVREPIAAASISVDGETEISICVDGVPDPFTVTSSGGLSTYKTFLVTDEDLNILAVTGNSTFDLDGAGPGTCLIWRLNFNNVFGNVVGLNAADLGGCFLLSNPITVYRQQTTAATIALEDGGTSLAICAGDGVSDAFTAVVEGGEGENSAWVITDEDLNILGLPEGPTFDLDGAGAGTCLVWYLTYNGDIAGLSVGNNAANLVGCSSLSNAITVERDGVSGGEIELSTGGDMLETCAGDGSADLFTVNTAGATGEAQVWVITDEDLNILALPQGPTFDLEGAGAGTCLVWNLAYNGNISGAEVGANAADLEGCFALSNPITVIRNGIAPASIELSTGGFALSTCAGDGVADLFTVNVDGGEGNSSAWIITDESLNILALPNGPTFDLEGAGAGVCLVWYATINGELTGAEVGANAGNIQGCFSLSNPITVTRNGIEGGEIALEGGGTELSICAGDGVADPFTAVVSGATGESSAWVITDESLNILALPEGPEFDLEGAGSGVCLLWYLSFNGEITGAAVGENAGNLSGCFALSNPITVTRDGVAGATISLEGGGDELSICAGDGIGDPFTVNVEGGEGASSAWVITDTDLNILGLPEGPTFDLDGAGAGTCLVWYLTYNGEVSGVMMGANAADLEGCFALSNAITVVRTGVSAAEIAIMDDGGTELTICAGDGVADPFTATVTGGEGASSAWIITDQDLNILGLPEGPTFDLEGAGAGVCLVWYATFNGELSGVEMGLNAGDITGCFALSNPITVTREGIAAASISIEGGGDMISICAGDGVSDMFTAVVEGGEGESSAWVITDENLNILALPEGPSFDLDGAGPGTCLVWYLTYNGEISGATMGANAADLGGCFALSNAITVIRTGAEAAVIALEDGSDEITICAGDGVSDAFTPSLENASGMNSAWVITDADLNILALPEGPSFDLDGAGEGVCLLWYVSFNGDLVGAEVGANAADLSGCFALSNSITINRVGVSGATITSDLGTEFTICAGDGVADPFTATVEGGEGAVTGWIITDTAANVLGLPEGPTFDLEGAGTGVCLVWYYNAVEALEVEVGDNVGDIEMCFALSNPITVTRQGVAAASLTVDEENTEVEICVGDGNPDLIMPIVSGGDGESNLWVITDSDSTVVGTPSAPPFNLEAAGPGSCLIWYVTYNGEAPEIGAGTTFSGVSGCAAVSNPITVIRNAVQGGTLALASDGTDSLTICAGDDVSDAFEVTIDGAVGESSAWVITDEDLNILGLPEGPTFDLEGAGAGVCLLWNLSFNGEITGAELDANAADLSGCFELSNPITVTRVTEGAQCAGLLKPEDVDIFPNPADGFISISLAAVPSEKVNAQVFDSFGRLVKNANDMMNNDMKMDLEDLAPGIYYLKITHGSDIMIKEFVKM